jgi:hypothetical protein
MLWKRGEINAGDVTSNKRAANRHLSARLDVCWQRDGEVLGGKQWAYQKTC